MITRKYQLAVFGENFSIASDEPEELMLEMIERINLLHKDLALSCERSSRSLMILALKLAKDAIEQEKQLENNLHSICHKIDSVLY
jgi:uncharacterized protein with PIN domain